MSLIEIIAAGVLAIWVYLAGARGLFWTARLDHDHERSPEPASWPALVAVIPARDEAVSISECLHSLFAQDYPGSFRIVLVDDQSSDGTAAVAAASAQSAGRSADLTIVAGRVLPAGWAGKVWALKQGIEHVEHLSDPPDYLLLTDADIAYAPDALRTLVGRALRSQLVLASLMVRLRCESLAERSFIPAFVFFFAMLYPFAWVNRSDCSTAAAAGGCMLIRRDALRNAGGIEAIREALIDDCALARRLKAVGPIWLGLTQRVRSLRPYPGLEDIRRMISRSAYDQLGYSPLLLAATLVGMALTYLAPPTLAIAASGPAEVFALAAWLLMALVFQPILRVYRLSPLWGVALPAIAAGFMAFTLDSAAQHFRGRSGLWKGRVGPNISARR